MFRHFISDPLIDWVFILVVAFTAVLVLVAAGVYVYLDTQSLLEAPATPATAAHAAFDPALLSGVVGDAAMRASITADHAAHYSIAPDPSLP